MTKRSVEYSAALMTEAPWFHEFRKMLILRHDGASKQEIQRMCVEDNLLGMPNKYRAQRTYSYLINRADMLDNHLLGLFCSSDLETQKLINFIAIIKGDRLFREMMNEVYREKCLVGYLELSVDDINIFFTEKATQDDDMNAWKDTTFTRLRSGYFQFMVNANLLRKEKSKYYITPPILDIALERYLQDNGEEIILKAITGAR